MGIMVNSLLWVMQDLYHPPQPQDPTSYKPRKHRVTPQIVMSPKALAICLASSRAVASATLNRATSSVSPHWTLGSGSRVWNLGFLGLCIWVCSDTQDSGRAAVLQVVMGLTFWFPTIFASGNDSAAERSIGNPDLQGRRNRRDNIGAMNNWNGVWGL